MTSPNTGLPCPPLTGLQACSDHTWVKRAIGILQGDGRRSADTHLINPVFRGLKGISIYLKDELTHPTGSLKHRLARSLFLYALCNGRIQQGTHPRRGIVRLHRRLVNPISPSMLGLPFIAVMPRSTIGREDRGDPALRRQMPFRGRARAKSTSRRRASPRRHGGYYLDQFTFAERATDWRGNNNIAETHLRPDARRAAPRPPLDRHERRHRRHLRHDRALHPLHATSTPACASSTSSTPSSSTPTPSGDRDVHLRPPVPHRGHRPARASSRPSSPASSTT